MRSLSVCPDIVVVAAVVWQVDGDGVEGETVREDG